MWDTLSGYAVSVVKLNDVPEGVKLPVEAYSLIPSK